ncbi:MAG: NusA-like transcription termination signal-binding factor [Caldivirga sp.]|jgi:N utilization substance protein A|uniref:NusA-like transcription termination signal-binding factor n=1 Tax=Caldivirga sp. MU80 TaxID=1650354 RepID=UPI0007462868|nr:NusA-like transcription termination signal-binding factor [Caldivirga sp. MU80]KUO83729.1 MAG: transcription elongation factor NusA [Caldivirga sp. MG_3]KUO86559.1 MAG: transcription elongation factor NusA [Caldivirga sp. CIS_19]NAZ28567.1 NusA-like transcription termination signal-binding factor [Caldivirga sp.]
MSRSRGRIILTDEELRYAALFESVTGITPRDAIYDPEFNRVIFIVDKNFAPLAVGKGGINVKKLRNLLGKDVEIVEYGDDPEELLRNALYPAKVLNVSINKLPNNGKVAVVRVEEGEKGIALGKYHKNLKRAILLAKRYFDIDNVKIP